MDTTIAAISTGQAPGGIGIVRVSGPGALEAAQKVFRARSGRRLAEMAGYSAALGEAFSTDGDKLDDCLALVFRAPKSYTGEDVVELSCHGGLYVTRQLLAALLDAGAKSAGRGEFTKRAFLNGKLDLAQAESVMELIGASGKQAARLASAAGDGALSRRIAGVRERLEASAVHLAAWADFPEEGLEAVDPVRLEKVLLESRGELEKLLENFRRGQIYREGLVTVIAGRPNVGKSTLMNLLAGRQRSIVTPYAGTTRDVVEEPVNLGGIPLLLADTAGLRDTDDPVEEIGVAAARGRIQSAQLVLAVFDGSKPLEEEDLRLMGSLRELPVIAVVNKSDLRQELDMSLARERFSHVVELSASTGQGLEDLEAALLDLTGGGFDPGEGELFTERQREAARSAKEALDEALRALSLGMTLDAVTVCLDAALGALYQLTGENVSEQVIEQVFEKFCVGK